MAHVDELKAASSVFKRDTLTYIVHNNNILYKEAIKNRALPLHNRHPKQEVPKI